MKSRVTLLIALLAIAGTTAGCGDEKVKEANTYVTAVNKAQGEFASQSHELVGEISRSSRKHDDATLKQFSAAVDVFLGRLRAIAPPASVKALHAKLTSTLVRFGASLRAVRADLTSDNAGRILDGQSKFANAARNFSRTMNATLAQINSTLKS